MNRNLARVVLLVAGLIWGAGFVVNKSILDSGWSDSQLLFVRFFTATIAIFIIYRKKIVRMVSASSLEMRERRELRSSQKKLKPIKEEIHTYTIIWGLILGVFLYLGFYFQTLGLYHTSPQNNSLITASYIILIPIIVLVFEKKAVHMKTLVAGAITIFGISFINVNLQTLSITFNFGDQMTFIGAIFWAIHLYILGKKTKQVDLFVLMAFQLLVFSIIAFPVMMLTSGLPPVDFTSVSSLITLGSAILIGFFASFVAFLFQSIGQKNTNEAEAAILIASESLFGPIFGMIFYPDGRFLNLVIGIVLVFIGIVLSELEEHHVNLIKRKVKGKK